jgi:hypothetical protein
MLAMIFSWALARPPGRRRKRALGLQRVQLLNKTAQFQCQ